MRKMLFLLLLLPALAGAQVDDWDIAFGKSLSLPHAKPIHMPERDYNPYDSLIDTFNYRQKQRLLIVREDSVYRKLFWRYIYTDDSLQKHKKADQWTFNWMRQHHIDSLPLIDFSRDELVRYSACAQCAAYCHHKTGDESCHRNACNFREAWFIRERTGR